MSEKLLKFPTLPQMRSFQEGRKANLISVFRARSCDACAKEIPREFRCCSQACFDKMPKEDPMQNMKWNIDLTGLQQGEWRFETFEGAVRKGKVTKINYKETTINGETVSWPDNIELGGDSVDVLSWNQIKTADKQ